MEYIICIANILCEDSIIPIIFSKYSTVPHDTVLGFIIIPTL